MEPAVVYRAVKGKLPRQSEVAAWKDQQFLDFLDFIKGYIERDTKKGTTTIRVTKDKQKSIELVLSAPYHPWQEFLFRVGGFSTDGDFHVGRQYAKLAAFTRQVLGFLKNNPGRISEEMRKVIAEEPRFAWALKHYQVQKTDMGADVIAPVNLDDVVPGQRQRVPQKTAEHMMVESSLSLWSLMETIAKSIKPGDVKGMDVKDKIAAIQKLSFLYGIGKHFKANTQVFQQINVHSAKREDLEKALLDYSVGKDKGNE